MGDNSEQGGATMDGLDALDGLVDLTYLDFSRNQTPGVIDHLANMTKLTFLQLQKNGITDVTKLGTLTTLQTLVLNNNDLSGGISPLHSLVDLRELHLRNTQLPSLAGTFTDTSSTDSIVWPQLRTLDVSGNTKWALREQVESWLLYQRFQGEGYQLAIDYNRVYQPSGTAYPFADANAESLLHVDGDVRYVTYEDFGARHDGTFDDYVAMVNAHKFANNYQKDHPDAQVEVRATAGTTYHIFNRYCTDWNEIKTDVDWCGATIVIHDEDVDNMPSRATPLFVARTLDGGTPHAQMKRSIWCEPRSTIAPPHSRERKTARISAHRKRRIGASFVQKSV